MKTEILDKAVIVAAHPDDEILWFSSLLTGVDRIVLCYLGELVNPEFGEFRAQALGRFPLAEKMTCLDVVALGVSRPKNFVAPRFSSYGIELVTPNGLPENGRKHYENNYLVLREKLSDILKKHRNVITHNPWGEYGHEEHVQVYRAVKSLQLEMGFEVWTSNYCSTRTIGLVSPIVNASRMLTLPTNPDLGRTIMEIYRETKCWTWYDNWQWPAEETFFKEAPPGSSGLAFGSVLPVNLIVKPPLPARLERSEPKAAGRFSKFVGLGKRS
jgi:hypothetical protein